MGPLLSSLGHRGADLGSQRLLHGAELRVGESLLHPLREARLARERYAGLNGLQFARPVSARNWLQASNPSERWKWDFMFQDLPPVKGHNVQLEGLHLEGSGPNYIPLHEVKSK